MNKNIIIIIAIVMLQIGCGSNKSGTKSEQVKEVQVTLKDGSVQSLKYSLAQTSDRVSFKMDIAEKECSHYTVDFSKSDIEPTYFREKTVEDLGDIVVKSSYFKDEFNDSNFAFSNHHYRYVYFVADDSVKKNCSLSASQHVVKISKEDLSQKILTLPKLTDEMNLKPEFADAMAGSANYLTYYISVKIGSDDDLRLILRSDDLSIAGLAVHMPVLGYKDIRRSYLNRYKESWDAPEAMPLPFVGKDARRVFKKDQFISDLTGYLNAIRTRYPLDYQILYIKDESNNFGGK